jgi:hypothetical protein
VDAVVDGLVDLYDEYGEVDAEDEEGGEQSFLASGMDDGELEACYALAGSHASIEDLADVYQSGPRYNAQVVIERRSLFSTRQPRPRLVARRARPRGRRSRHRARARSPGPREPDEPEPDLAAASRRAA